MKILFLAFTCKTFDNGQIQIDRPDLTRKMGCMETWVPKVQALGHKVIFFDGGYEVEEYDSKYNILHTAESDSYDYSPLPGENIPSRLFKRLQAAIRWSLNNEEFDYIFRTDDGTYVNVHILDKILKELESGKDFILPAMGGGGGGMFLSRRACEKIIEYNNPNNLHMEDQVVVDFFRNNQFEFTTGTCKHLCFQYVVSEDYFTIHYATGKRLYFVDMIMSYYYSGTPIHRKIAINFPIDTNYNISCNSWNTPLEQTPGWYHFDRDFYNWEHYGGGARSYYSCSTQNPFISNTIHELAFYTLDLNKELFKNYVDSVIPGGYIYLFYIDRNVPLPSFVNEDCELISTHDCLDLKIQFFQDKPGTLYKLKVVK